MQIDVRPAGRQEWAVAAEVLATAFVDDPLIRWLSPSPRQDVALFGCMIASRHHTDVDLAVTDDGEVVGAALWDPPGRAVPVWRQALDVPRWAAALRSHTLRGVRLDASFNRAFPDQPFWYLASIGAVRRGQGIGGALIRHRLADLDTISYLECSKAENVDLYRRYGYEHAGTIQIPGGPAPTRMIRPARASQFD